MTDRLNPRFSPKTVLLIPLFLFLWGCLKPIERVEVSRVADFSSIKRIGVFPFSKRGGWVESQVLVTAGFENVFKEGGFEVVRNDEMGRTLDSSSEIAGQIRNGLPLGVGVFPSDALKKIREETGADALLLGRIRDAYCKGTFWCRVESDFQLMDTRSGKTLMTGTGIGEGSTLSVSAKQAAAKALRTIKAE